MPFSNFFKTRPLSARRRCDRPLSAEHRRVEENAAGARNWSKWGPYLSERQWGTVREDYSGDGEAWEHFPHDMARSRAYRWGEDGIAGFSDVEQRLCLSLALWNGQDSILKERLFGLSNGEGNHGEDVKELYYYLDAVPSHAYLRMLYKYPQREFPYDQLREENQRRDRNAPEFELWETGIFEEHRYFDVTVEYAKEDVEDVVMRITARNCGPDPAPLHVIPQLVFRNIWSWEKTNARPELRASNESQIHLQCPRLGHLSAVYTSGGRALFTENETNDARVWGQPPRPGYFKDAFHEGIVGGRHEATNPEQRGTKAGIVYDWHLQPGESRSVRLRLQTGREVRPSLGPVDAMIQTRREEADAFFEELHADMQDEDRRRVQRQAIAGLIWSKQFYHFDVEKWLHGDPLKPQPPQSRRNGRNYEWRHLNNADIISMPDKWEYPWYAAWDLAFHCIPFALFDPHFAKGQLDLLTREWYMHPNGQLPAYEWEFSDVNPPVHAWATWRVYEIEKQQTGKGDRAFLERVFHKLLLNFTWWVNQKDHEGHNVFQGGFLGLDNIGVFDRSKPLPTGGFLSQSDGTSWMAMYSLNLMRIALELAQENSVYEDIATKFFEHFLHIAEAMTNMRDKGIGLWDEQDEFYYDELNIERNGEFTRLPVRLRSLVGLIPLFAVEVLEPELLARVPGFSRRVDWVLENKPNLAALISRWHEPGTGERRLLSLLRGHRLKALLARMLDPDEFLSDYGVRGLSRVHHDPPFVFQWDNQRFEVRYTPAESDTWLFGGNSNWRGPVWMPVNFLILESLQRFHSYYGEDFRVEFPVRTGKTTHLQDIADNLAERLCQIFLKDAQGKRPVFDHAPHLRDDPEFNDHILFYEYFHGDTGRGVGASHQTGWTALVANLLGGRPTFPNKS